VQSVAFVCQIQNIRNERRELMPKLGIEYDLEAQKNLKVPLGQRELYPSVGKYVAEICREQGVQFAFGCPGGHIWQLTSAISRIGIKTVTFAHEQNAVYAGEAYTQVTQKPVVCYGTVGPGTANAFSAMQQAWLSNSPIIYLAGGHEVEHDGLYNTIQESYAARFFEHVTKWSTRVTYPWQVKQFLTRGFKIAQAAPKAPVAFELGIDLLFTKNDEVRQHYFGGFFRHHHDYIENWRKENTAKPLISAADIDAVARAAKAIMSAKSPMLIIGDQCSWDQAGPEIEEFVNLTKMPFTTRRLGRAVVSEKHPYAHRGFPTFEKEIDLLVSGGLKVGFFDGYASGWPETIQISNCQEQVWTYVKSLEVLMGNQKSVFKQLNDYIKANRLKVSKEREEWLKRCQEDGDRAETRRRDRAYKFGPEHPRYRDGRFLHFGYMSQIIREVNDELYDSKTRVVIDGFTMSDFVMPYLRFTRPASCITANDQAGVGHGVGQAIGAAFGDMERGELLPILSLLGDSGAMNAGWDIEVAARYKLPIVYMVNNNGGWMPGMKYVWCGPNWDVFGDQDVYGNTWQGRMQMGEERPVLGIQFEKFAEAIGAYGMLCNNEATFKEDLKKAYAIAEKGQPVVMNCIMDQHLVNRAVMSPAYCVMYTHIPYDELPSRGKAARKRFLSQWLPGLQKEPAMAFPDAWEPLTEAELGYVPKSDWFK
jgi:thiamine pyrophosphate-dependent acetolactate synthase large subunit-like protein